MVLNIKRKSYFLGLRETNYNDYDLYKSCLRDKKWVHMAGFSYDEYKNKSDIVSYMLKNSENEYKYIVYKKINYESIGFCHFRQYRIDSCDLMYFGGVRKCFISSGLGLKGAAFVLDKMFVKYNWITSIYSQIIYSNYSSIRLNIALGFKNTGCLYINSNKYLLMYTTKYMFYNSNITNYLLNNIYK